MLKWHLITMYIIGTYSELGGHCKGHKGHSLHLNENRFNHYVQKRLLYSKSFFTFCMSIKLAMRVICRGRGPGAGRGPVKRGIRAGRYDIFVILNKKKM